jgi:serine phosphatase RsbU (regulator of sigma subunit)
MTTFDAHGPQKIMVVDDFPTTRRLLEHKLKKTYHVVTAASGQEAIEMASREKPDMVLLDIEMPGMDGFQTLETLRKGVIDAAVPVIFLTAREDKESRHRGLAAGAVDFLTKPFDKEELFIKVGNHLALYEARKEIEQANVKMEEELRMAADLQLSLLPTEFPVSERVRFCATYVPASSVSGDFYDVVEIPSGRIAFTLVDVSGHGVRSAIIGAMFKMEFQAVSKATYSPSRFLERLNEDMVGVTPDADYLTVFCAIIDTETMGMVFTNAGHPKPFLYKKSAGEIIELYEGGLFIGIFPGVEFDEGSVALEPGDRILVFTDGVTEAPDREGNLERLYGTQRLKDLFVAHIDEPGEDVLAHIMSDLEEFHGDSTFDDDVSLLLVSIE